MPSVYVRSEPRMVVKKLTGALPVHHKVLERRRADAKPSALRYTLQLLVGLHFRRCIDPLRVAEFRVDRRGQIRSSGLLIRTAH